MARIVAGPVSFLFPTRIFLFPSVIVTTSSDITVKKKFFKKWLTPLKHHQFWRNTRHKLIFSCTLQRNSPRVEDQKFLLFLLENICFAVVILNYRVLTNDYLTSNPPAHTTHLPTQPTCFCYVWSPNPNYLSTLSHVWLSLPTHHSMLSSTVPPDLPVHTKFD